MKSLSLIILTLACSASLIRAVNIVWVSDMFEANTGTANDPDGPYPDQGFVDLLTGAGHTVTRFNPADATPITGPEVDMLNASDLVILSRGILSAAFNGAGQTLPWNTQVTKPLLSINSFLSRNNRLGWFSGNTMPDTLSSTFTFPNPFDPVSAYIIGSTAMSGATTSNGMFEDMTAQLGAGNDQGVTIMTSPPVAGHTVIATTDTPAGGFQIVSFPMGTALEGNSAGQTLQGFRMHFTAGNREPVAPNNQIGRAGYENLSPEAEGMFLRAVLLTANNGVVPEPGSLGLLAFAAAGFLRRRRR